MPESTIVTPGTPWRKRKAQPGTLSSGRRAARRAASPSDSLASRPPRRGSITQMGIWRRFSSSALALAPWKSQSR